MDPLIVFNGLWHGSQVTLQLVVMFHLVDKRSSKGRTIFSTLTGLWECGTLYTQKLYRESNFSLRIYNACIPVTNLFKIFIYDLYNVQGFYSLTGFSKKIHEYVLLLTLPFPIITILLYEGSLSVTLYLSITPHCQVHA